MLANIFLIWYIAKSKKRRQLKLKSGIKTLAMWLIIIVISVIVISSILDNSSNKLAYSELVSKIEAGEVKEIELAAGADCGHP